MKVKHGHTVSRNAPADNNNDINRPQVLESVNNRIYFYADIDRENILKLNKSLMEMDAAHISAALNNSMDSFLPIFLHINSYGGYIFDGLAASDQIGLSKSPIITVVDGICASAATFLSLRGTKRYIKPNSFMLIHQLSSEMWGKYDDFIDEMKNLDKLMEIIRGIYLKNSKLKASKLDEILSRDLYFDAKECVKYGLVDEILK